MAEKESQAHRDWFVQLCRKLETEKGLSRLGARRLVLAMADQEKLLDWLVQDLDRPFELIRLMLSNRSRFHFQPHFASGYVEKLGLNARTLGEKSRGVEVTRRHCPGTPLRKDSITFG